jgi:hypothetical protein
MQLRRDAKVLRRRLSHQAEPMLLQNQTVHSVTNVMEPFKLLLSCIYTSKITLQSLMLAKACLQMKCMHLLLAS